MPPVSATPQNPQAAAYAALIQRCRDDISYFADTFLGVSLWSSQLEAACLVRDHDRVAIRACRGVGKTYLAAVIVLWFLFTQGPGTKVITTAPTQHQVRNLLWTDIGALVRRAEERGYPLGGAISSTRLEVSPDWFAVGISSNDPDRYLGFHAPAILFLVDEASGVEQPILDAAKGYATGAVAKTLYIGNGTQTSGGLYDAFTNDAEIWETLGISMFDSPNFTVEQVAEYPRVQAYMEAHDLPYSTEIVPGHVRRALPSPKVVDTALVEWGPDSPLFAVFVLGEFPAQGSNSVVPLADVIKAQARYAEWEPTKDLLDTDIQCDVARFGDDNTVIGTLDYGEELDRFTIADVYNGQNTEWTAGAMLRAAAAAENQGRVVRRLIVDDAGVGGGVTDQLEAEKRKGTHFYEIVPFNGGNHARKKGKGGYPNARSEAWFVFAEEALPRLALDPSKKLLADLVAPTYLLDSAGRREVERKKDTKKRLGRSPDYGDTALMAYAPRATIRRARVATVSVYQ